MKHTTEEYLAWIDNKLAILTEIENTTLVMPMEVIARASLLVIRDVLVRHRGETEFFVSVGRDKPAKNGGRQVCRVCDELFPCPTYLDIAQRLDEVM